MPDSGTIYVETVGSGCVVVALTTRVPHILSVFRNYPTIGKITRVDDNGYTTFTLEPRGVLPDTLTRQLIASLEPRLQAAWLYVCNYSDKSGAAFGVRLRHGTLSQQACQELAERMRGVCAEQGIIIAPRSFEANGFIAVVDGMTVKPHTARIPTAVDPGEDTLLASLCAVSPDAGIFFTFAIVCPPDQMPGTFILKQLWQR